MDKPSKVRVAVVGATGYTGAELLRLMHGHTGIEVTTIAGHGKAGQPIASVLPSFHGVIRGDVSAVDIDQIARTADAAFCGLPHGASQTIVRQLRDRGLVVFDLSADFRLRDLAVYREWYGEHEAADLAAQAVYGLCEIERDAIRKADLIAVPGCYPTASALAAAPLVKHGLIDLESIIIDAKSGASGAGRGLSESTHFAQLSDGFRAYKVGGKHRHTPEIEQTLSRIAGKPITITFTPHLVPMIRGILSTVYAKQLTPFTAEKATELARAMYEGSPSVTVLDAGSDPDTQWVKGSNRCFIAYTIDKRTGRVIAQAAIDNLVKGASGQALQCFNLRYGFAEGHGLEAVGLFPVMRILHFSDVHVQDPIWSMPMRELMSKRLVGAVNLWMHRERLFRAVPAKLDALDRFRVEQSIDAVLCTGDFTALGTEGETRAARAAMQRFTNAPRGLTLVPGNHDLYVRDAVEDARFERHFGDLLGSDRPELAVDGPYPFVRLWGDEIVIIGLNSARPNAMPFESSGIIPAAQLDQLVKILDEYPGRLCIVMTHYAPLTKAGRPDSAHHGLDNAAELLAICARPNVMLLHGHIHHRYCHGATDRHPWLFCAGSVTHEGREGLWLYEVDGGRVRATPGSFADGSYRLEPALAVEFSTGRT